MNTKSILLAYASRFGSTQEVAETIASILGDAGFEVDLQPMQEVKSLDRYDAVVLGAAIYNAKWNAVAHQFVSQYQDALSQLPVVIFTLGPLSPSDAAKRNSRHQLDSELAKYLWLKPVAVEIFAGKYDPSKPGLNFFERFLPARDYRNWDAIRAWANELSAQLQRARMLQPA
ncbi:MAG TPA: flavodoxin domain-containing protein [Anaerolineales bacterium]|nr:flavodoxin domain-containing protein [Anaerolineales bacterium]